MPKTTVDEDGGMVASHHDVRFSRDAFHVESITIAMMPQPLPHFQFRLGVAAANVRHHEVTLFGSEAVGHSITR